MKSYNIHLIRHGLTIANTEGIYAGVADYSLSDEGAMMLKVLKNKCEYPNIKNLYTSPLKRCVETCNILYPQIKPIVISEFIECDFGDWDGKPIDELKNEKGFSDWLDSSKNFTPPNAESSHEFAIRICKAFDNLVEKLLREGITDSAIVMHGGAIMILLSFYGLPREGFNKWRTESGCGYTVRITPSLWMKDKVMEVSGRVPF